MTPTTPTTHALVIGAGMAGLMTARVLADFFDQVTLIERDTLPEHPVHRKGVPQAHHLHNLLVRGWRNLEYLFPNLEHDLTAAGANAIEWPSDLVWLGRAGWSPRVRTGLTTFSATRYLLEWAVRERVKGYPNITFRQNLSVTGLLTTPDNQRVTGVQVVPHPKPEGDNTSPTDYTADLVVDASGRSSRTPQWLEALGYPAPPQETINPYVGYATRYYTVPDDPERDWKVLLIQSRPPTNNRAGATFIMERDQWVVTLVGVGGDYPPTTEDGFMDFLQSLPDHALYEFVRQATPSTDIYSYRIPVNRNIHYERMPRWLDHYVVLGDAVCSFNPTYGQGISVASEGVMTLLRCLREQEQQRPDGNKDGLARRFQQELAKTIAVPWTFTTGEDSRYPTTEGSHQDPQTRITQWLLDGMMLYATENREAFRTLVEVMHMVKQPTAILRPDFVLWSAALNVMRQVYG